VRRILVTLLLVSTALGQSSLRKYTAFDVAVVFADNEVKGEQIFRDRVQIEGVISSIETGFISGAYVELGGPTLTGGVTCVVESEYVNQLSELHRGQRVIMSGQNASRHLGQVFFHECQFVSFYRPPPPPPASKAPAALRPPAPEYIPLDSLSLSKLKEAAPPPSWRTDTQIRAVPGPMMVMNPSNSIAANLGEVFLGRRKKFPKQKSVNGVFHVGIGVSMPKPTHRVNPEYSAEAINARHQGTCLLLMVVGADGRPRDVKVVRSLGMGLDEKAVEAVQQWAFRPAVMDGKPVPVELNVEAYFNID